MGIFSRNNTKPSREKSRKKRAEICSTFFTKEYFSIKNEIQEDLQVSEADVVEFANRKVDAWKVLDEFITKFMIQWDENYAPNGSVIRNWEFYADVVHYSRFNLGAEVSKKITVEEILEHIGYLHQATKQGALVMMPGSNLEKSKRYRGMLSSNSFSGKMGWDWENSTANERNFVDHELAALVGDFMTDVFDNYGLKSESAFSGLFAAAILNSWDSSLERSKLRG